MLENAQLVDVVAVLGMAMRPSNSNHVPIADRDALADAFRSEKEVDLRSALLRVADGHADEIAENFESLKLTQRCAFERSIRALGFLVNRKYQISVGEISLSVLTEEIVDALYSSVGMNLQFVSLTVPPGSLDVREYVASLSNRMIDEKGGALLVVDVGRNGWEHVHGLTLAPKKLEVVGEWLRTAGGIPVANEVSPVAGWRNRKSNSEPLLRSVNNTLAYSLKHQPAQYGERDLAVDAVVSGPFVDPWARFCALEGVALPRGSSGLDKASPGPGKASQPGSRRCQNCGKRIGNERRPNLKSCNDRCRKAASRKRIAAMRALRLSNGSFREPSP